MIFALSIYVIGIDRKVENDGYCLAPSIFLPLTFAKLFSGIA